VPTYRLDLEYDGTRYSGWQAQANARTVSGELRRAIEAAGAAVVDLGGSGRTDAGVHALHQVAHARLDRTVSPGSFRHAVNDALPPDVHVSAWTPADDRFHARHDAMRRTYLYQIAVRRTAFAKRFVWWIRDPLDAVAMTRAAAALVGRHDFARLCERPDERSSTIVVLDEARVARDGDLLLVRLSASHFLWRMVRRVVGTLVEIGRGRLDPATIEALLAGATDVAPAKWTAPPSGLFLERVEYPGEAPAGEPRPAFAVAPSGPAGARFVGRRNGRAPAPVPRGRRRS